MNTPRPAPRVPRAQLARTYRRRRTVALLVALAAAGVCAYLVFGPSSGDSSAAPTVRISEQPVLYPVTLSPALAPALAPAPALPEPTPPGPAEPAPAEQDHDDQAPDEQGHIEPVAAVQAAVPPATAPPAACDRSPTVRTGQEQKFHHIPGTCPPALD